MSTAAGGRAGRVLGLSVILFAAALSTGPLGAQTPTAEGILERASARYAAATSLCADFTQHLVVPLLGDERSGSGRLCQARPNLFAMRFTQPVGDAVVVDGTSVWVYYPSMDATQVLRFPVAQAPGGFDFHREFLDRPAEKYRATREASEQIDGRRTHRIRLIPRGTAAYVAAVVWIDDDGVLRKIRVEEENGSARTVTLTSVSMGSTPPAGWFEFTPPRGTQVIGR